MSTAKTECLHSPLCECSARREEVVRLSRSLTDSPGVGVCAYFRLVLDCNFAPCKNPDISRWIRSQISGFSMLPDFSTSVHCYIKRTHPSLLDRVRQTLSESDGLAEGGGCALQRGRMYLFFSRCLCVTSGVRVHESRLIAPQHANCTNAETDRTGHPC